MTENIIIVISMYSSAAEEMLAHMYVPDPMYCARGGGRLHWLDVGFGESPGINIPELDLLVCV